MGVREGLEQFLPTGHSVQEPEPGLSLYIPMESILIKDYLVDIFVKKKRDYKKVSTCASRNVKGSA